MDLGTDGPPDGRGLFEAVYAHEGPGVNGAVIEPWLGRFGDEYRARIASAVRSAVLAEPDREALWELYALSRVSDILLLAFQPPGRRPWDGPEQAPDEYLGLFTRLGMVPFAESAVFDPFLHEIVEVEQAADPDEPIAVTAVVWPGLWLGPVLFSRAGVRVRAGTRHAERGVADRAPLYWAHRRRHRPAVDLSHGWGSNSQWRTAFRVDLRLAGTDRLNIADGDRHIDAVAEDETASLLTPAERRDLLRNRCLLRTPDNPAVSPLDADLFPFDWRLTDDGAPPSP
ncbi:hypothetical protein ACFZDK_36325 [Streptomyces sp. NPDC007901]|uniref:hypothetical protein n=1 Tax=Streptomyces sp. NPDC007901 TaxID=3364785 RepID=UPI0036EDC1F4